jgi:DNA polymerase/3'-5' exonuclease PolX
MNSLILSCLNKLHEQIEHEKNAYKMSDKKEYTIQNFRALNFEKVIKIIKKINFEITNSEQIKGIKGIGTGTLKRIDEILKTGNLKELKNNDTTNELKEIIGIGDSTAYKLANKYGITTVSQLISAVENNKIKITEQIRLGLKYYGIVQGNIPRKETELIEKYIFNEATYIDKKLNILFCGSYRRGNVVSGDIDILIYHDDVITENDIKNNKSYLEMLVNNLIKNKFIIDNLTNKNYNVKYMGFCKYKKNPVRRIDIRFIAKESLPTAMLYFTGPYELNTLMRTEAKKQNMLLNEYGIYKIKNNKFTKINVLHETDIFHLLGMKYLRPDEREKYNQS